MIDGSSPSEHEGAFTEDDLLPISALQHLLFCERRAALVHIEGIWAENPFTVDGRHLNERAEGPDVGMHGDLRVARGLSLRSFRLGLSGKADVVEFHRVLETVPGPNQPGRASPMGAVLPGVSGHWRPFPVEYKRGRLRHEEGYEVQLCAQALCLEEMLQVEVPAGALFYGKTRRRLQIEFDPKLRRETESAAARLHLLIRSGETPPAVNEKKCEGCSLIDLCLPAVLGGRRSVRRYLSGAFADVEREKGG